MLYLFLADGFEETEAVATADIIRRAGLPIRLCAVKDSLSVIGAHDIAVNADVKIGDCDFEDLSGVILPGGLPGVTNLAASQKLADIIKSAYDAGKLVAAICAAPTILSNLGLLNGKNATVYPSMSDEIIKGGAIYKDTPQVDGNIITANGPDTAIKFGLMIAEYFCGADTANKIEKAL